MPCHKATFIHTKAVTGNSCCLLLRSEDMLEELSEEESRIMQRVQRPALEVLEDMLRKDWVLIQNPKIRQVAFWKKTRKARSYAYRKIKVILEEQE